MALTVRGLATEGVTVPLTTQYLEEADQLAQELAVVDHGQVIATGTPDELKARTGAQTLTVRPASPQDLSMLINVVGRLTLTEPEVRGTTVTAPLTDPDVVAAVVRRLDEGRVRLAELSLRGSTLDEVFLLLLFTDLEKGFFDRLRSLPIARFSPLAGRIAADLVKGQPGDAAGRRGPRPADLGPGGPPGDRVPAIRCPLHRFVRAARRSRLQAPRIAAH